MTLINPNIISPSQDFLKPSTVAYILSCIESGREDELPPTPIVRLDNDHQYVAIDGHNLIAVRAFLNQQVDIHVAVNASDGLPETSPDNVTRNKELQDKFDDCLHQRAIAASKGISSFQDLIDHNQDVFKKDG